jgi:hypothetical protein
MTTTIVSYLYAFISIGILLTPFLIIIVTIFNLLFNLFRRIFNRRISKRPEDLDLTYKSSDWIISIVTSLAIIIAMLYIIYVFLLSGILWL